MPGKEEKRAREIIESHSSQIQEIKKQSGWNGAGKYIYELLMEEGFGFHNSTVLSIAEINKWKEQSREERRKAQ